jgi:metal-responsive CopG/Arc/MetJ family transcriptional regulator
MKSDTKLVSITIPTDWWDAATRLADKRGQTRSELMRSLLWDALSEGERKHLSEPQLRGRPAKVEPRV